MVKLWLVLGQDPFRLIVVYFDSSRLIVVHCVSLRVLVYTISFFYRKFANFWYVTFCVYNLITFWTRSHGLSQAIFDCVRSVQIFSCIRSEYGDLLRTEYRDLLRKSPYSVRIQESTDQKKNPFFGHFSQFFLFPLRLLFPFDIISA